MRIDNWSLLWSLWPWNPNNRWLSLDTAADPSWCLEEDNYNPGWARPGVVQADGNRSKVSCSWCQARWRWCRQLELIFHWLRSSIMSACHNYHNHICLITNTRKHFLRLRCRWLTTTPLSFHSNYLLEYLLNSVVLCYVSLIDGHSSQDKTNVILEITYLMTLLTFLIDCAVKI